MLIFADDFDGTELDHSKWFPHYLPHWSTLDASHARFEIAESKLRLFVDAEQQPWCPEHDGQVRVSNLQTGHFSGPVGSSTGQHRFRDNLTVRTAVEEKRLFLPHYCFLEMKARARLNPWNLAALWLIGFEDAPYRSGEITVFEAFGHNCSGTRSRIGRGVKQIRDPKLAVEVDNSELPIDLENWHVYAMHWTPAGVAFFVDGKLVSKTAQSPNYPMQLMLNFYDIPDFGLRENARDAWFEIDYIRAFDTLQY